MSSSKEERSCRKNDGGRASPHLSIECRFDTREIGDRVIVTASSFYHFMKVPNNSRYISSLGCFSSPIFCTLQQDVSV